MFSRSALNSFLLINFLYILFFHIDSNIAQISAKKEQLPKIYYHSIENNAFIIERADGSQREIMAEYTIPESDLSYVITGPDWSATHRYFAWTLASNQFGSFIPVSSGFVFDYQNKAKG